MAGAILWSLRRRLPRTRAIALVAWAISAIALSTIISLVAGGLLAKRDIADAKAYCEQLAVQLEQHKQTAGAYPTDLSSLRGNGDGPRLVRESLTYSSEGGQFELSFVDPRGLLNGLSYRSGEKQWVEWD